MRVKRREEKREERVRISYTDKDVRVNRRESRKREE